VTYIPLVQASPAEVYDQLVASVAEELKQVPLLSCLSRLQLRRVARDVKERSFKPGTVVTRQGQMSGVGFFLIKEGEASVSVNGTEVARLGRGDHFGELGLLTGRSRTATVTAETRLECLELASWTFRRFVRENPDISWKLLQHLATLVADAGEQEGALA
jgi:CRP/FNR family transcriptional regulator, cyclic AMP receptor protein